MASLDGFSVDDEARLCAQALVAGVRGFGLSGFRV